MCRANDLADGSRQVTELHVPGDFADLHSFTLKRLDHDVRTLTRCQVAVIPHERLERLTEEQPRLTRIYWFGPTSMPPSIASGRCPWAAAVLRNAWPIYSVRWKCDWGSSGWRRTGASTFN
jgi:hypothetical protein